MALIRVLSPGLFTTVQDLGRPGHAALGISACGAADAVALRIGNRLVGNPATAPALEMTLTGATLQFAAAAWVALTGAECAASQGRPQTAATIAVPMWTVVPVAAGAVLRCAAIAHGARTYMCIAGGLDVPLVLGSAATHVPSGLGGLNGRALRAGDELSVAATALTPGPGQVAPALVARLYRPGQPRVLRITEGPQCDRFAAAALATLQSAEYVVSARSDRMGVRLVGPSVFPVGPSSPSHPPGQLDAETRPGELLTEGVYLGAVQIPADGQPILLSVDHQTTGGYPKLASLIAADLALLGQLRPGERVRFARVSLAEADALRREQEQILSSAALVGG